MTPLTAFAVLVALAALVAVLRAFVLLVPPLSDEHMTELADRIRRDAEREEAANRQGGTP